MSQSHSAVLSVVGSSFAEITFEGMRVLTPHKAIPVFVLPKTIREEVSHPLRHGH